MLQFNFRRTFVAGLFICLPLLVTLWTIQFILVRIENTVTPLVIQSMRLMGLGAWLQVAWVDYLAPLLSILLGLFSIFLVGLFGGNVLGRQVLRGFEALVLQVPVVRSIYGATRQFVTTFSQAQGRSFSRVVLVEYPRVGVWTLGLVTNAAPARVVDSVGGPMASVFLPTTPNPTSGWLTFVPEAQLVDVAMSVDDAFKLIISGGVLGAQEPK
jgi:uncharacterized membrane protein